MAGGKGEEIRVLGIEYTVQLVDDEEGKDAKETVVNVTNHS